MKLTTISRHLRDELRGLAFSPPVAYVYNPLDYAWEPHRRYLEKFGSGNPEALLLGMNPGPWGMAQTGVPFGAVGKVRGWLGLDGAVGKPEHEHPDRPVVGFGSRREEVSGARLWGWAEARFGSPERFFSRFFVGNYCPLLFLDEKGRNLTPDKLKAADRDALLAPCDQALRALVQTLGVRRAIGVGGFAESRLRAAVGDLEVEIGSILHPSPASPAANRGWAEAAERQLRELGIELP
ncbi:MAG: single-strand selective monofunctional uracil-DNA glycosylase [Thermoanaerobaculia bacterium]|nr:single-strand selective monofunctional uracil-DNA glycosylase [Thermoanaerobaculia bacterium]